jgi:hypothetical protein
MAMKLCVMASSINHWGGFRRLGKKWPDKTRKSVIKELERVKAEIEGWIQDLEEQPCVSTNGK